MAETEQKPKKAPPYFRAMHTSRAVRRGIVKCMNDIAAGKLTPQVGGRLLYGLNIVQASIDSDVIERRLAALEEATQHHQHRQLEAPAQRQPLRIIDGECS